MKNLHFCTKDLLIEIHEAQHGNIVDTFRTGFVPSLYSGDIININERDKNKKDTKICTGRVEYVLPLEFGELQKFEHWSKALPELKESYKGRKFDRQHWFFVIGIKLIKEVEND